MSALQVKLFITFMLFFLLLYLVLVKMTPDPRVPPWYSRNFTPPLKPQDAVWQPVRGARHRLYVYSAFLDVRTVPQVAVVAATWTRFNERLTCILRLKDKGTFMLEAQTVVLPEHHFWFNSAALVMCLLDNEEFQPREAVGGSISVTAWPESTEHPSNSLIVVDSKPTENTEGLIHLCLQPMFLTDSIVTDHLIEWLEMNRLLGVSRFYVYNINMTERVRCIMEEYSKVGLVQIRSYDMVFTFDEIWRGSFQMAAIHDCLYRSMADAEWMLNLDVDEMIIPTEHDTLKDLVRSSLAPSGFAFKNTFFYTFFDDDPLAPANLLSALKTRRSKLIYRIGRTKYIVRSKDAQQIGVHFVWYFVNESYWMAEVPPHMGLSHHYRKKCISANSSEPRDGCLLHHTVVDRSAHRWSRILAKKVKEQKEHLSRNCLI